MNIKNISQLTKPPKTLTTHLADGSELVLTVEHTLSYITYINVINGAINLMFVKDHIYSPAAYDFVIRYAIVTAYTDMSYIDDIHLLYQFVYDSGVYEQLTNPLNDYICIAQYQSILKALDEKIQMIHDNKGD